MIHRMWGHFEAWNCNRTALHWSMFYWIVHKFIINWLMDLEYILVCADVYECDSVCTTLLQVKEAKVTETKINEAREHFRPAAARASSLYFTMNDLNKIHPMYQFSLKVPCLLTHHVTDPCHGPPVRPFFTLTSLLFPSSFHLLTVFYALCPAFIVFVAP